MGSIDKQKLGGAQCAPSERRRRLLCLFFAQSATYAHSWSPLKLSSRAAPVPIRPLTKNSRRIKSVLKRRIVPFRSTKDDLSEEDIIVLESENTLLRDTIKQLEEENQRLKKKAKIVLENFEGEKWFKTEDSEERSMEPVGITLTGEEIGQNELWCDELDGGELIFHVFVGKDWRRQWKIQTVF